jgi:hypothetical protein
MKKIALLVTVISFFFSGNVMAQRIVGGDVEFMDGATEANIDFCIEGSDRLAAIAEFVMTLPEGFGLKTRGRGFANTINLDMADGFASTINKRDNGDFYVLLSCTDGYEFLENNGKIITLTLTKADGVADGIYEANVHDIILGDIQAKQMNTETSNTFKIGVNQTVGIRGIYAEGEDAPLYNTAGQRVQKAHKGLYIQNGKKVVKK